MKNSTSSHKYAVVVAGGSGTRLWPVSRKDLPKQMQTFVGDRTLIEDTVERLVDIMPYENIYISTTSNYAKKIREMFSEIPKDNIVVEPIARGTTAAFALFSEVIYRRDPEAVIFSLASDHSISDLGAFHAAIETSYSYIDEHPGSIALIGVAPNKPDTGMGYIKIDELLSQNPDVYSIEKFVEKPSLKIAENYVKAGEYYWNAAYYCFRAATLLQAYEEADSSIPGAIREYLSTQKIEDFEKVPIKTHEIELINASRFPLVMVAANFQWSDVGTWSSLHELLARMSGSSGNVSGGPNHVDLDSKNSMVFSEDDSKLIATVGLSDVVVVNTKDVLLVLDKDHTQDVKKVIEELKKRGLEKYV